MSTRRRQRGGQGVAANAVAQRVNPTVPDPRVAGALQNNLREALKLRLQRMRESYEVIRDDLRAIVKDTKSALAACDADKGMQVANSSKERLQRIAMHIDAFTARYGQNSQIDRMMELFSGYCKTHEVNKGEVLYTDPNVVKGNIDSCNIIIKEVAQAVYDRRGGNVVRDSTFDEEVINEIKQNYGYLAGMDNFFICLDQFFKDKNQPKALNTTPPLQGGDTRRKNRRLK